MPTSSQSRLTFFLAFGALALATLPQVPAQTLAAEAAAALEVSSAPAPHPVERYESLWLKPLFSQPAPPEVKPVAPVTNPDAIYRLLGMGVTADGTELAYVQPAKGGRIDEVSRSARTGPVLLGVERHPDGRVDAVTFRRGGEVIRAVASALSPNPAKTVTRALPPNDTDELPPRPEGTTFEEHRLKLSGRLQNRALVVPRPK